MLNQDLVKKRFAHTFVNECPHCDKGIHVDILKIHSNELDGTISVNLICQCPFCFGIFFAQYDYELLLDPLGFPRFSSKVVYYPPKKKLPAIQYEIENLSPNFIKSFQDASSVEQLNLTDLAGLSYRKAFEFLIKDYAIYLTPDKKIDIINDTSVSNVIINRIPAKQEFEELKKIASRAWWLGNDYAHYKKHYDDKDITDLKQCIDIVSHQICMKIRHSHQVYTIKKREKIEKNKKK